jgi:protein kinase-like protein/NB-ARC domain-containing protein
MNSERWELVHRLFERALERPTAERAVFVHSACGHDDELRAELSSLLASHRAAEDVPPLPLEWLGSVAAREVDFLSSGDCVAGRYRIQALLGRGGVGEVYEAWDEELSIAVALKILRHAGESDDASRQLRLEGLLARTVWHPGVCRVYDVGCHDEDGHATWFLTMELLRGETLAQRIRRRGRLSQDEALAIVRQVAGGLQAAHQAGITHLDLKPGNVMLVAGDPGERALVTDFGTARMTSAPAGEGSEGGPVFGTPAYMAPEQVRGEVAGPAADVYALGAMLFEMVTGVVPFAGSSSLETARRRLEEDPPSPRGLAPALDAHWEATILRCMAREANQRFHRAEDVAVALAGGAVEKTTPHDLARPARGALPVERDAFVGREPDVAALRSEFSDGARLVTLTGVGGMGKTRLASGYAWRNLDDWPAGVWFCDLTQARGIDGIASALASVFSVPLGAGDPLDQLGRVIAGHNRCLLILDNFEQVAAHAEQTVGRWMRQAPQARFLVTSRERLALEGERTRIVEALSPEAGLELFAARARALLHRFAPSAAEERIIGEIVRLTEGMPLAIELAAARMRVMGSEQILAQMRNRFRLLAGGTSRHHETLEAAIDGSWELLRPWERAAWAQCSVFEGGFTLEAAEGVLDLGHGRTHRRLSPSCSRWSTRIW